MVNTIDDGVKAVAKDFISKKRIKAPIGDFAQVGVTIIEQARARTQLVKLPGTKKQKAHALFCDGKTAKEVSVIMGITYANAHYYKRAFAKAAK